MLLRSHLTWSHVFGQAFMIVHAQSFTYLLNLSCGYFLVMLFAPATVCTSPPCSVIESSVCLSLCLWLSNPIFLTAGCDHSLLPVDICSCLLFFPLSHLIFCFEMQLCKHLETLGRLIIVPVSRPLADSKILEAERTLY